jgi:hypothetical protein
MNAAGNSKQLGAFFAKGASSRAISAGRHNKRPRLMCRSVLTSCHCQPFYALLLSIFIPHNPETPPLNNFPHTVCHFTHSAKGRNPKPGRETKRESKHKAEARLHRIRVKLYEKRMAAIEGKHIAKTDSEAMLTTPEVCASLKDRGLYHGGTAEQGQLPCKSWPCSRTGAGPSHVRELDLLTYVSWTCSRTRAVLAHVRELDRLPYESWTCSRTRAGPDCMSHPVPDWEGPLIAPNGDTDCA